MAYQYKLDKNGKATDGRYLRNINNPGTGYVAVEEKPDDLSIYDKPEYKNIKLKEVLIKERNERILEADKWELPTILKRNNITIEKVEVYKQTLCDMPETHTTIEQLENPEWPEKLITQELL